MRRFGIAKVKSKVQNLEAESQQLADSINQEIEKNRDLLRKGDLDALLKRGWTQEWNDLVKTMDLLELINSQRIGGLSFKEQLAAYIQKYGIPPSMAGGAITSTQIQFIKDLYEIVYQKTPAQAFKPQDLIQEIFDGNLQKARDFISELGQNPSDIGLYLELVYRLEGKFGEIGIFDKCIEFLVENEIVLDKVPDRPRYDAYTLKVYYTYFKALADNIGIDKAIQSLTDRFKTLHLKNGVPLRLDDLNNFILEAFDDFAHTQSRQNAIYELEQYKFDFYELVDDDGYPLVYKDPKMRCYYLTELLYQQLGVDIILGNELSVEDISFHHIEQNKLLWEVKDLIATHKDHDSYIDHIQDLSKILQDQKIQDQIKHIKKDKNEIKDIVENNVAPEFDDLPNDWATFQKIDFINKWHYLQQLKAQYGAQAKWAFLSHFYPDFMIENHPHRYIDKTPPFSLK